MRLLALHYVALPLLVKSVRCEAAVATFSWFYSYIRIANSLKQLPQCFELFFTDSSVIIVGQLHSFIDPLFQLYNILAAVTYIMLFYKICIGPFGAPPSSDGTCERHC